MSGHLASVDIEKVERLGSSFRDPSGYVMRYRGEVWRVVQPGFREHYDLLMQSGLYGRLVELGLLVAHEEVEQVVSERGRDSSKPLLHIFECWKVANSRTQAGGCI